MPDEIDLLGAFRADTAGPDDAAWERARAAVALAEDAATADPGSPRRRPRGIRGFRRNRVTRGRSFSPPWPSLPGPPPGYSRRSCRDRRA